MEQKNGELNEELLRHRLALFIAFRGLDKVVVVLKDIIIELKGMKR
jgi:hypothetical protein